MDDVDRLFHYLVNHLATSAPEYLGRPFQVSELYQRLIPYRHHRTALGFDAVEDYDFAMLRLLAGVRGYARLDPDDAQLALAAEVEATNPTPGAFREFAAASMTLDHDAVTRFLDPQTTYGPPSSTPGSASRYAPPDIATPPELLPDVRAIDIATQTTAPMDGVPSTDVGAGPLHASTVCPACGETLPSGRSVRYCPFCGLRLGEVDCRQCGETLDRAWVYCLACGTKIDER